LTLIDQHFRSTASKKKKEISHLCLNKEKKISNLAQTSMHVLSYQ